MDKTAFSDLVITRIHSVSTIYTAAHARSRRTNRPCWAIVYKWEGETEYRVGTRTYISNAKNPILLPRGCAYEWLCTRAGRYSIIEFDADAENSRPLGFRLTTADPLMTLFHDLERISTLKDDWWQLEAKMRTYQILLYLLQGAPAAAYASSHKLKIIQPAVDYMHGHYDRNMTNEELAALTSVSTVYFRKLFTQIFGMSPIHYLRHLRVEKAKEILCSDFGSISDVAASLGYPSIYHFSKVFKRSTGMSPTEYTKTHTANSAGSASPEGAKKPTY